MADGEDRAQFIARLTAPGGRYFTPPTRQTVQAFTVLRPAGFGLMLRVLPGGSWRLREYDADGDEESRGDA